MSKEAMKLALEALESYKSFIDDAHILEGQWNWIDGADNAQALLREALAEQPAQPKYRRGDRLICLETEEYCVIHISGTDRQWVKFPDAHIGVYKNEQLAELFELLPKEIEIEQPAQQEPVAYWVPKAEQFCIADSSGRPFAKAWEQLYASPPAQRTWVGLTDVEWMNIVNKDQAWFGQRPDEVAHEVAKLVEAKLKEKNT